MQPPSGGEPDETPPQMLTEGSTENFQTNFKKQRIELKFDEWVQLKDIGKQVVVSPPNQHPFEITLKGKTVRFDFAEEEVLRENATYTINFGEAIQDLTQGNPSENIRFVFATGPIIDSLSLNGRVVDGFTGDAVENAVFMLYDNLNDTVPRTEKPFYFARTDTAGRFKVENIRADTFKAFVLMDADANYIFNQPSEKIAFTDELVVVTDTTSNSLQFRLFQETGKLKIKEEKTETYGYAFFQMNQEVKDVTVGFSSSKIRAFRRMSNDSIEIWYDMDTVQNFKIYVDQDTMLNDTIRMRPGKKEEFLEATTFQPVNKSGLRSKRRKRPQTKVKEGESRMIEASPISANPTKSVAINFSQPIDSMNKSLVQLLEDTAQTSVPYELKLDATDRRILRLNHKWKEAMSYDLRFMPGALKSWYGIRNDTISQPISISDKKSFGNIILKVNELDSTQHYVAEVLQGTKLIRTFLIQNQSKFKKELKFEPPAKYTIRLTLDVNQNGKWDTGNYDEKRQPEPVYWKKDTPLRANWDVEIEVTGKVFE